MTKQEAIEILEETGFIAHSMTDVDTALDMAIDALKAQDRPIICPRCGRTFAESEGREINETEQTT